MKNLKMMFQLIMQLSNRVKIIYTGQKVKNILYKKHKHVKCKNNKKNMRLPVSPSPYSAMESVSLSGDCFSLPNLFVPPSLISINVIIFLFSIQFITLDT